MACTPERWQVLKKQAALARSFGIELQLTTPREAGDLYPISTLPAAGVKLLQAQGVSGAAWLRAVMEHHERADGSGYPQRLREVS